MTKRDLQPANRLSGVNPSAMRALFTIANQMRAEGKRVIDFGLGDINIPLPEAVKHAIVNATNTGKTKYGPNQGQPDVRTRLAEHYNQTYGTDITLNHILLTCGSLESLFNIALSYVNPGDEVMMVEPEFAYFGYQVKIAGGKIVPIGTNMDQEFAVRPEQIQEQITDKTKALLVNYPNNPTAGILQDHEFKAVVDICEDNDIILISDEAYEKVTYDGFKHKSAIDYGYENTLVVNSASKSMCMTGLRVGYTVTLNEKLIKPVVQVHQYNTAHPSLNNQYGFLAGINHEREILDNSISILQTRRDALVESWGKIPGMRFIKPKATFYLYPNVTDIGMTGEEFSAFALKHGVVMTPGKTFSFDATNPGGAEHVRVSYGMTGEDDIREAAITLTTALENR